MLNRAICSLLCGVVWMLIVPTAAWPGSLFRWPQSNGSYFPFFGFNFSGFELFGPHNPVVSQSIAFPCETGAPTCTYYFTLPSGVSSIAIELWGGGGGGGRGGGASNNKNWGGGGGGGGGLGGYGYKTVQVDASMERLSIQVGSGGVGAGILGDGRGGAGQPSFVQKFPEKNVAYVNGGCGGYPGVTGKPSNKGGDGGSGCDGSGSGGNGAMDAGGGGGGGRGLSDRHGGNGGAVAAQYKRGGGGTGSANDAPWAWGPGIKDCNGNGGDGGAGGINGSNGHSASPGSCGGGGGGGGGAGSPAYRSGDNGTGGGLGGKGGAGMVIIYY
jgi:hypothetical protein